MPRAPRDAISLLAELAGLREAPIREALELIRRGDAYERFEIPKVGARSPRAITAPREPLKHVQRALIEIIEPLALGRAVHGFRRGRSIVTGARAHLSARALINVDLRDFFHTVDTTRVTRMLERSLV